jgi:hypothetical protein
MSHRARKVAIAEAFLEQKLRFYFGNALDMPILVLCSLNGSATVVLPSTGSPMAVPIDNGARRENERRVA